MATVVRRRTLVNPARRRGYTRRRLTLAQKLAGFGGKRAQSAAMSHRKRRNRGGISTVSRKAFRRGGAGTSSAKYRYKAQRHAYRRTLREESGKPVRRNRHSAHRKRTRRARRNVSAIVTAGLPFANPARRRKRKSSMARVHRKARRRRSNASSRPRRRRHTNAFGHFRRRHRRRSNPVYHARRRGRRMNSYRRRRNLGRGSSSVTSSLMKGVYVVGGAVGSRWLTQVVLGTGNTGVMGYAGNAVATLALGWAGSKFLGRGTGPWIIAGGAAGLILRVIQDQTPLGKYFNLSGIDSGMGAIIPANFVMPPIYTGNNGMVRVPTGFGPGQVPATSAGAVVRTGMGAPVGRGLYSTGGGRGLYRPA